MSGNRHLRILGQDDRLLYARTATGVLVYTAIDTDWHWLEAPHEGQAKHGSPEWREDGQFMHDWVSSHPEDYDWQVCDIEPWPPEADEAFVQKSGAHYLPRKEKRARRWLWPHRDAAPRRSVRRAGRVLVELGAATLAAGLAVSQIPFQAAGRNRLGQIFSGLGRARAQAAW